MSDTATRKIVQIVSGDGAAATVRSLNLDGQVITWREALAFGPVHLDPTTPEFFEARAKYLGTEASELSEQWARLKAIARDPGAELTLWFGRDLFCQVILWSLLSGLGETSSTISLVLPSGDSPRCLSGSQDDFRLWFESRQPLTREVCEAAASTWRGYASTDPRDLQNALADSPSWIQAGINAHLARFPDLSGLGSDERTLLKVLESTGENGTSFGPLFRAFSKSRPDLGWGDLGVIELLQQLASGSDPVVVFDEASVASATSIRLSPRGRAWLRDNRASHIGVDRRRQIGGVCVGSSTSSNWRWTGSAITLVN